MRLRLVICTLCLTSTGIFTTAAWGAAPVEIRRTFQLGATPQIEVHDISGSIEVVGKDQPQVELRVIKRGDDQQRVDIEIKSTGDLLKVRTQYPEHCDDCKKIHIEYRLQVPKGARLRCTNVSGPVKATDLQGAVNLKSVSGSISARGMAGELHASAVSGSVELWRPASARANLHASTVSGAVRLHVDRNAGAQLRFSTVSGALRARFRSRTRAALVSTSEARSALAARPSTPARSAVRCSCCPCSSQTRSQGQNPAVRGKKQTAEPQDRSDTGHSDPRALRSGSLRLCCRTACLSGLSVFPQHAGQGSCRVTIRDIPRASPGPGLA